MSGNIIEQAVQQGVAEGAEGAIGRAFDVLDANFWTVLWLMVLGALVSTCVVAAIRRKFGTSKAANEWMGYGGALVWTVAIEVAFLKYKLGMVEWFPLIATSLTAGAMASASHRPIYRVGLLLWLIFLRLLGGFAEKQGVEQEEVAEALGETMTKLGFRKTK